jgi:hypothetical protein
MATQTDASFDCLGYLKKQGYLVKTEHWSLNPKYSVPEIATAISTASGKQARIIDVEGLLMRNDIII